MECISHHSLLTSFALPLADGGTMARRLHFRGEGVIYTRARRKSLSPDNVLVRRIAQAAGLGARNSIVMPVPHRGGLSVDIPRLRLLLGTRHELGWVQARKVHGSVASVDSNAEVILSTNWGLHNGPSRDSRDTRKIQRSGHSFCDPRSLTNRRIAEVRCQRSHDLPSLRSMY